MNAVPSYERPAISPFEVYYDPDTGILGSGKSYGIFSVNGLPMRAKSLSDFDAEVAPTPAGFGVFWEFLRANPDADRELHNIAAKYTRSDHSTELTEELYDYIVDQLGKQWASITTSWKALAHTIARRRATWLRERAARIPVTGGGTEGLKLVADSKTEKPLDLIIKKEEREYVLREVAKLPKVEQRILDVFAKSKSVRAAATTLGMAESTYRGKLHASLTKIQPPAG